MFILSLDYDGTIVTDKKYRAQHKGSGEPKMDVINKAKEFQKTGLCEIVLWTCRDAGSLQNAVDKCKEYGIVLSSVNSNSPSQVSYMQKCLKKNQVFCTRKIFADLYVDDKSPGSIEYFLAIDVEKTVKKYANRK